MNGFIRKSVLLITLTLLAGCFTTTLNLGTLADAPKADPLYCGDWHFAWKDGDQDKSADLAIRNFDGKQYYAEWKEPNQKVLRMSGFLVRIKDKTFAQLTELNAKGELPSEHLIVGVHLAGDKLTLRQLNEDFFKDVKTDADLRKKVEENLNNDAMYQESATGALISQP